MIEVAPPSFFVTLRNANRARQQEWDNGGKIDLSYRGNELAGEVGEACNIIKKLERERLGIRGSRATVANLAEEVADAVICCDLIGLHADFNLEAAIISKFNLTSAEVGLSTRIAGWGIGHGRQPVIDQELLNVGKNVITEALKRFPGLKPEDVPVGVIFAAMLAAWNGQVE